MTSPLHYWISQSSFVFTIYRFIGFVRVRFRFLHFIANKKARRQKDQICYYHFCFTQNILITSAEIANISAWETLFEIWSVLQIFILSPPSSWYFPSIFDHLQLQHPAIEWEHLKMFGCCHSLWMRGQITNSGQGMRLPGQWSEARKFLWFHSASREHIPLLS